MNTKRLVALLVSAGVAQAASAATVWLKDGNGVVCKNTASISAENPTGIIGLGEVSRTGDLSLKIVNPVGGVISPNSGQCTNIPKAPVETPIVFEGNIATDIKHVHMIKPGTGGRDECLDQGENFVGIRTEQNPGLWDTQNQYALEFTFGFQDGCISGPLPTLNRGVRIGRDGGGDAGFDWLYTGKYHLFNEQNPIPEPGSLLLLGAGATGLMMAAWARRRRPNQA